jgi:hypothetical protein
LASTLPRCLPIGSASTLQQSRLCVRTASSNGFGAPRPNDYHCRDGHRRWWPPRRRTRMKAGPAQRAPARGRSACVDQSGHRVRTSAALAPMAYNGNIARGIQRSRGYRVFKAQFRHRKEPKTCQRVFVSSNWSRAFAYSRSAA